MEAARQVVVEQLEEGEEQGWLLVVEAMGWESGVVAMGLVLGLAMHCQLAEPLEGL